MINSMQPQRTQRRVRYLILDTRYLSAHKYQVSSIKYLCALCVLCVLCCSFVFADFPTTQPYAGVTYEHQSRTNPPLNIFAVTIDLRDSKAAIEVAPAGADPDGSDGPWQTTLDETPDVAAREGFEVAVNGDFFAVEEVIDPATN